MASTTRPHRAIRLALIPLLLVVFMSACTSPNQEGTSSTISINLTATPSPAPTQSLTPTTPATPMPTPSPLPTPSPTLTEPPRLVPEGLSAEVAQGLFAPAGEGGRYACAYGKDILINIQSDMQTEGLHLINADGSLIRTLQRDTTLQSLTVVDHYLYAMDYTKTDSSGMGLRLTVLDLDNPTRLYPLDLYVVDYAICNGRLYYIDAKKERKLFVADCDGTQAQELTDFTVADMQVAEDRIFLINETNYWVMSMALDGTWLVSDQRYRNSSMTYVDNKLYFFTSSEKSSNILRVPLDLTRGNYYPLDINVYILIKSLNHYKGFFYFQGQNPADEEMYLWRMSSEYGQSQAKLIDAKGIYHLQRIGDVLIFRSNEYASRHCLVRLDGTGFREIMD